MRRTLLPLAVTALGMGLLKAACGCSGGSVAPMEDAGDESVDRRDAIASADVTDDTSVPGPIDGWELFKDYDPNCGFYIPSSKDKFPPPIQWEPCDSGAQPGGIDCREMKEDWVPWSTGAAMGPAIWGTTTATGGVTLWVSRLVRAGGAQWIYRLIADADGDVHQAILETAIGSCTSGRGDVHDGKYAFRVYDSSATGKMSDLGGGAIAGNVDDPRPTAFLHFQDQQSHSLVAGSPGLMDLPTVNNLNLHSWTNPASIQTIWSASQDNGLSQDSVFFVGTTIFWSSDSEAYSKLKVYTPTSGVKDFITFGADATRGAADLGTDGVDMLWTVGSGRAGSTGVFPTVSVMTSPFATDPTLLVPRRLRSESSYGFGTNRFIVGCGRAMRQDDKGLRIVRISDGQSWFLPATAPWLWVSPVALTCTELFATAESLMPNDHTTLARVRLDSLGPGVPAD